MSKKKILIIQPIHEAGIKLLMDNSNYEYEIIENLEAQDIKSKISNCDAISIRTAKLSGELIVKAYSNVFDIPYTIIRPSALYGERCVSRRVGQIFIENVHQLCRYVSLCTNFLYSFKCWIYD